MATLVVQAHPLDDSYSAALCDAIVAARPDAEVLRLGQGDRLLATSFAGVTDLVVVYPTWWGSPPAMLLSPLVDVLGPWVDGGEPGETCPVRSIERLTVVTSHGSSKAVNTLQGEPGLQLWRRTILPRCAPKATFEWKSLYKMDRIDHEARSSFLTEVAGRS